MSTEIRVSELERYHPKKHTIYRMYKRVEPEPIPGTEVEIAQWCSNENIRFETWDMSRPSEKPYFRKAYLWGSSTKDKGEIDKLKKEMICIEKIYQSKVKKFRIQVEEATEKAKEATNKFIEEL